MPSRVLVALAVVFLSVPVLAPAVDGATAPPRPFVSSTDQCLGPGATLKFFSGGFHAPATGGPFVLVSGYRNYVQVLGSSPRGTEQIATLPVLSTGGTVPSYYVDGSISLPAGEGGIYGWQLSQPFYASPFFIGPPSPPVNQPPASYVSYDATRWTCSPSLATNATCLSPVGGSLSLTGQVNRPNGQIDVAFDVDATQYKQPYANIVPTVGTTGPNGEINVTFSTPALSPGAHTFYVGSGGFDQPDYYWTVDDQGTYRNGQRQPNQIVSVPIVVPCPSAALLITPGSFDFGTVNVTAASDSAAFNVVNIGTLAAPISAIATGGAQGSEFAVESKGCDGVTLAPGAGCAVTVQFAPGGVGPRAGTLTATSSNSATASVNLTGTGVQPPGLTINPTSKNFGSVPEHGSSDATTFTLTNTGSQPQTITSVALTGAQQGEFALDPDTCGSAVVAGGGTCTVKAAFQPTGSGARTAKLVVKSDANLSVTATLKGTAQAGQLGFDPNPADFGVVAVGSTSTPITVKITNGGAAPLTITTVHLGGAHAGDFLVAGTSCTGQLIAPATSCSVDVLFRPGAAGDRSATLDFDDEDGTTSDGLHGVGIFQAILKFTPPVVSAGSLATVVGQSFPANTVIMLEWQESGIHVPIQVTTNDVGAFRKSFVIIVGERLGPRHLEPAPNAGVLDEPRPVAALLVQAPTFRPQGVAIRSGGFSPSLVSRG